MELVKYTHEHSKVWDDFIKTAKNGHFLFFRDYMEYHADRFLDHSVMFFDDKKRLIALLPANMSDNILFTHQGLTFGGFVVGRKMTTDIMLTLFSLLIDYLRGIRVEKLVYKPIPSIYAALPSQEDIYALFVNDARLLRRDVSSAISLATDFKYSKGRKWTVNKAKKEALELCLETDFTQFWRLLNGVLENQHETKAVHTISEIEYLYNRFSDNVKLYVVKKEGVTIAGAVIYETPLVAHTQYLANSDEGRAIGALDLLIDHLIKNVYKNKQYFDFGISTTEQGRVLNKGLIAQKEGFGASAITHDFYELGIK